MFNLPKANPNTANASCWVNVQYANKATENIALAPSRMGSNANKLHINLAQSDNPQHVDLYCKAANAAAVKLSSIDIPKYDTPLPAATIVGQTYGFSALRKVELPQLEQALQANVTKIIPSLSANDRILFESYKNFKQELSPLAQQQFDRYATQEHNLYRINRWVSAYRTDLQQSNPSALTALKDFVGTQLNLPTNNLLADARQLVMPNMRNACLKVETGNNGRPSVFMSGSNGCSDSTDVATLWTYDMMGKIHSVQYPELCLAGTNLTACDNNLSNQIWSTRSAGTNLQQFHQGSSCLDLSSGIAPQPAGRGSLTTYTCGGGNNQKWTIIPQSQNILLASIPAQNLPLVIRAMQ